MRIMATVIAASLMWVVAAAAQQGVPIPPTPIPPTPIPPATVAAPHELPDPPAPPSRQAMPLLPQAVTPDSSKINPIPAPAATMPKAVAAPNSVAGVASHIGLSRDTAERRETRALNALEAAGYNNFYEVERVDHVYRATVSDSGKHYAVIVYPDTDRRALRDDAPAGRVTRVLNFLTLQGYTMVNAIRPEGSNYRATVTQGGRQFDVLVDPDHGQVAQHD